VAPRRHGIFHVVSLRRARHLGAITTAAIRTIGSGTGARSHGEADIAMITAAMRSIWSGA